jgi:hypothetical protein
MENKHNYFSWNMNANYTCSSIDYTSGSFLMLHCSLNVFTLPYHLKTLFNII